MYVPLLVSLLNFAGLDLTYFSPSFSLMLLFHPFVCHFYFRANLTPLVQVALLTFLCSLSLSLLYSNSCFWFLFWEENFQRKFNCFIIWCRWHSSSCSFLVLWLSEHPFSEDNWKKTGHPFYPVLVVHVLLVFFTPVLICLLCHLRKFLFSLHCFSWSFPSLARSPYFSYSCV